MKKMNLKIYLAVALFAAVTPAVSAQTKTAESPIKIACNNLQKKGDQLLIDATVKVQTSLLESKSAIELTPVVEGANQKEGLPSILINGKNSQKVYDRKKALGNLNEPARYKVIDASKQSEVTIPYTMSIPWEAWMKGGKLTIAQDICGCCKKEPMEPMLVGAIKAAPESRYEVQPHYAFITPKAETEKHRAEVGTAYLIFPVDKIVIHPDLYNNASELAKINNTINTVVNDKNVKVQGVQLKGFASPESPYKHNTYLADGRVKALKEYVRKQHEFKDSFYTISSEPEDWAGFKAQAEVDNNIPSKDKVMEIINSSDEPDQKEAKLKAMPEAYKYVLTKIFPSLRRSEYRVDYVVREFSVEEGREIIKTNPKQLSLSEMFAVANSYDTKSAEYKNVFATAVKMFPNDPVANLNSAILALREKDLDSAAQYLEKAGNSPEAVHARGIWNMLKGNLTQAKKYLEQAETAGVKEATANLKELAKKEADNAIFDSFK